jgi:hypothetical protein
MKLEFSRQFSKNPKISNFMKIRSVGTELFHADRRKDRHYEANSRFSQFCESALRRSLKSPYHKIDRRISNNIIVAQTTGCQITQDNHIQVTVGFVVNKVALEHFFSSKYFSSLLYHSTDAPYSHFIHLPPTVFHFSKGSFVE